jgi:hypothetical protein
MDATFRHVRSPHDEVADPKMPFDSIKWAFEEHLHETDTGEFNYAILHGHEDYPTIRPIT